MLRKRELIPPLTLLASQGRVVRAWDFKQKQNLVIAFLDAHCALCEKFVRTLAAHAADIREREAVALLVFLATPGTSLGVFPPSGIIVGIDVSGNGIKRFLGQDAITGQGLVRRGIFVTDRYGELHDQWIVQGHGFPQMEEIMNSLNQIEMACEECGVSCFPSDE